MNFKEKLIDGELFSDERGLLKSFNNFNFKEIVRFYEISPKSTSVVRAWQAHKKESKWFYCTKGAFIVKLIKLNSFDNPDSQLKISSYILTSDKAEILFIPGGYANGFKSICEDSKLMVFSNFDMISSREDDFRFKWDQWIENW
jgi:dTDP-4-dehydrorhamnose 3,5-epimerase